MNKIRAAKPQDIVQIKTICAETADESLRKNEKMRSITTLLFAEYYIKHEVQNCFVLEDAGKVVGYILCSTDIKRFLKAYRTDIFKAVTSLSVLWGVACLFIPLKYLLLQKNYPAHLHIDILNACQSAGYGSELMRTLLNHLKKQKIKGVCLSCNQNNTKALRFYRKFGFTPLLKAFGGVMMGIKF